MPLPSLEELHRALVALCRGTGGERAEIAALPSLRIVLTRIQTELAGCELADHIVDLERH